MTVVFLHVLGSLQSPRIAKVNRRGLNGQFRASFKGSRVVLCFVLVVLG